VNVCYPNNNAVTYNMGMPTFIFVTQLMLLNAVPVLYSTVLYRYCQHRGYGTNLALELGLAWFPTLKVPILSAFPDI